MRLLLYGLLFGVGVISQTSLAAVVTAASNSGVVDTRRPIVGLTGTGRVDTRALGMQIIVR